MMEKVITDENAPVIVMKIHEEHAHNHDGEENPDDIRLSIPKLMLLGVLYTASNAQQRAEKFYELIQFDLDNEIC